MIELVPVELGAALGVLQRRDEAILERIDEDYARRCTELLEWGSLAPPRLAYNVVSAPQSHDHGSFDSWRTRERDQRAGSGSEEVG